MALSALLPSIMKIKYNHAVHMSSEAVNIGHPPLSTTETLIKGIKARDIKTLNQLYDLYAPALFGYILGKVISEKVAVQVLQKTFLKIWAGIDAYDEKNSRLLTWMLNIALKESMNNLSH